MESISNAADCMRSDLLAWVHYGFQDPSSVYYCFPYPQYASSERGFKAVNPEAFPNRGAFVALLNRTSAAELQRQCGEIVVVRINRDEPDENPEYAGPLDPRANKFCARLPQGSSVNPELTITKLSAHGLSSRLVTVIELGSAFDISKPTKRSLGLSSPSSTESIDTSLVVIRNGDRLHGPFEYALGENGHIVLRGSSDYDFRVYSSIDASSMDEVIVHDMNGYSVAEFRLKSQLDDAIGSGRYRGQFDWIPLDKLQAILERAMKQSAEFTDISKNAFRRFKREINAIEDTLADANVDDARKRRLLSIVSDVEYFADLPDELREAVMAGLDDHKLAEIVLAPENFPSFRSRIRALPELQSEYEAERARLNAQLDGLRKSVATARAELDEVRDAKARAQQDLESYENELLAARKEELEGIEAKCDSLRTVISELETQRDTLQNDIASLESQIDDVISSLDDKARLSGEIIQSELVRRAIAYANGASATSTGSGKLQFPSVASPCEEDGDLIDMLYDHVVESAGRSYSRNDLINFFTCISQGYMTTFAGLPGTGKTSLCALIAGALGLNSADAPRYTEISVERGWTSYRDYIGYYNPLSKTMEMSDPAVFSAIQALSEEAGSHMAPDRVAPYLFLLDEANLSPVEHYWAPFLKACDSFMRKPLLLSLGGGEPVLVPSHVRFLATVNYDHTTEELSPRYLDRSWVIMLDPDMIDYDSVAQPGDNAEPLGPSSARDAVSYERLMRAFGPRRDVMIDESLEEVLDTVLKTCSAYSHPVSQRSQIMIRNYVATASLLMDRDSADTRLAPLDYAIAQKILPSIAGSAEQYDDYLHALDEQCANLPVTRERLRHILRVGSGSGYYQFFA